MSNNPNNKSRKRRCKPESVEGSKTSRSILGSPQKTGTVPTIRRPTTNVLGDRNFVKSGPVFSYKMTDDHGFAPNPFWGELTLATCKPQIRLHKDRGAWIAGFTSGSLCGDSVGRERLVYLMLVTERKITIANYFLDPRFEKKIPDMSKPGRINQVGDNIYKPSRHSPFFFERVRGPYHNDQSFKENDLSGKYVLLSTHFYYFGGKPIDLPLDARPTVPNGQSGHGSQTHDAARARRFIEYVSSNFAPGIHAAPHSWPVNDHGWQNAFDN